MARASKEVAPSPDGKAKDDGLGADGAAGNDGQQNTGEPTGGEPNAGGDGAAADPGAAGGAGDGADGETAAAGSDNEPLPPVEPEPSKVVFLVENWSLPVIDEFPVLLHLDNASPSSRAIHAIKLYMAPNEQRDFEFTEETYALFKRHMEQIAYLNGWRAGEGLVVTMGADDADD